MSHLFNMRFFYAAPNSAQCRDHIQANKGCITYKGSNYCQTATARAQQLTIELVNPMVIYLLRLYILMCMNLLRIHSPVLSYVFA